MSFLFKPMTEEDFESVNLLEKGEYEFNVLKSTTKTSKSGNLMSELLLQVWDKNQKEHFVYDYLIFSDVPLNIKKVKRFCDCVGLSKEYESGTLQENLNNFSGKALIDIQDGASKEGGGNWPKKNVVVEYIKQSVSEIEDYFNDKIPF